MQRPLRGTGKDGRNTKSWRQAGCQALAPWDPMSWEELPHRSCSEPQLPWNGLGTGSQDGFVLGSAVAKLWWDRAGLPRAGQAGFLSIPSWLQAPAHLWAQRAPYSVHTSSLIPSTFSSSLRIHEFQLLSEASSRNTQTHSHFWTLPCLPSRALLSTGLFSLYVLDKYSALWLSWCTLKVHPPPTSPWAPTTESATPLALSKILPGSSCHFNCSLTWQKNWGLLFYSDWLAMPRM